MSPRAGRRLAAGLLVVSFTLAAGVSVAPVVPVEAKRPPLAPPLPLEREGRWPLLEETRDAALQAELEAVVGRNRRWAALARREKLAVGVMDLSDPAAPRFARVNGRTPLYAASLAKIAILLAAEEAIAEGDLVETPEIRRDLEDMIRVSSNPAATRTIDRVGLDRIEASVKRWGLYDARRGGGLWVGKRYGRGGERRGDPVANLSHGATVEQVCRFYYRLATGRLIDAEHSRRMLEALVDPGLHHKFVSVLDRRAPRARLYRKSGTFRQWHSDSAIVWGEVWRRYILVALVEDEEGEDVLRGILPAVEEILRPEAGPPRG